MMMMDCVWCENEMHTHTDSLTQRVNEYEYEYDFNGLWMVGFDVTIHQRHHLLLP